MYCYSLTFQTAPRRRGDGRDALLHARGRARAALPQVPRGPNQFYI